MGQKFDALKQKIQNADKDQLKNLMTQVRQEKDQGNIGEDEESSLIELIKDQLGGGIADKFGL